MNIVDVSYAIEMSLARELDWRSFMEDYLHRCIAIIQLFYWIDSYFFKTMEKANEDATLLCKIMVYNATVWMQLHITYQHSPKTLDLL